MLIEIGLCAMHAFSASTYQFMITKLTDVMLTCSWRQCADRQWCWSCMHRVMQAAGDQ